MRVIRNSTNKVLKNASGKVLKIQQYGYIEPNPDLFQFEIDVDAGQVITLPTVNSFTYLNTSGTSVSSGTLVYDYIVSWGDGTPTANITTFNSANRIHTYENAGRYLIEITSSAQKFPSFLCSDSSAANIRTAITRVISWGNVGLKGLNFHSCTALTTMPEQQGKLTTLLTADSFCYGCTGLTTIPYGIFFETETATINIASFNSVFYNCTRLLSVHSTLFRDAALARDFTNAFRGCGKLTYIPEELFANCPNVTSFGSTFYNCSLIQSPPALLFYYNSVNPCSFGNTFYNCDSIIEIPAGFFDNVKSTSFQGTFDNCGNLTTIPEYLFQGQVLCTTFYQCFQTCAKLTHIPVGLFDLGTPNVCTNMSYVFQSCGTGTNVTDFTVPSGLFDDLVNVTTFAFCFSGCSKLPTIPTGLFDTCTLVQYFHFVFASTKISSIPTGLFSNCTEVIHFYGAFSGCTSLTSAGIPSSLFTNCTKVTLFGFNSQGYESYGLFYGCNNAGFTSIPAGLFASCPNVTHFKGAFMNCTNLASIPTDLLRYNTVVTDVTYMFYGTKLTTLSSNVFQYNRSITDVTACFANCTSLTTIDENIFDTYSQQTNALVNFTSCFSGCTALTSIPANLFRYSVNAKFFASTFQSCTGLTSIPGTLFQYNTIIETLTSCFRQCSNIAAIPSGLLDGKTQVSDIQYCFYYWHALTSIPSNLFASIGTTRSVNFSYCLAVQSTTTTTHNKYTGAVEELWNKPNSPTGTQCFRNRTQISNYASIPAAWK